MWRMELQEDDADTQQWNMERVHCQAAEMFRDCGPYVSRYIGHLPHSGQKRFTFVTKTHIYYTVTS